MKPSISRSTKAQEAISQIFQAHPAPLSLAEVHGLVRIAHPKVAYSTVFRVVGRLEAEGKLVRIDWRERGSRYEWAERPHHHHIVCQVCGSVCDLDCDLFSFQEEEIQKLSGFAVRRHSIEFEGICPSCQERRG